MAGDKKDFPFPESPLKLLYLIWSPEPTTKRIEKALLNLYQSREKRYAQEVLADLDELAAAHIYLELLRLDWRYRLQEAKGRTRKDVAPSPAGRKTRAAMRCLRFTVGSTKSALPRSGPAGSHQGCSMPGARKPERRRRSVRRARSRWRSLASG